MEFLAEYGLFLAKTVTILVAVLVVVFAIIGLGHRARRVEKGHIEVRSLNDAIDDSARTLKHAILDPDSFKRDEKHRRKEDKQERKARKREARHGGEPPKNRVFVIDFDGDLQASAVAHLRQEVTAISFDEGLGGHLLDVDAGGERLLIAGDDDAANAWICVECFQRAIELFDEECVERVQRLRPVESDERDPSAGFGEDEGHCSS